ncbi:hypothetical protein BJ138DRAFT_1152042 [Hygrophoropsis aurantiaca]|uniref:Uncharacterized protein n=1 Tax=Hygrophoropsis aurantiaca TaxID=72124 RepID=A0ACB8ACQ9_9AGAM|nr:hypothetical protein BJ138DRAFT_1152042 [Hygrophoropsis aurantiaca]
MTSCFRCHQSHSGPQAFLLTCSQCKRAWHHKCHIPPIQDVELLQRIKATNAKDTANGLDAWTCKKCSRNSSKQRSESTVTDTSTSREESIVSKMLETDTRSSSVTASSASWHTAREQSVGSPVTNLRTKITEHIKRSSFGAGSIKPAIPERDVSDRRSMSSLTAQARASESIVGADMDADGDVVMQQHDDSDTDDLYAPVGSRVLYVHPPLRAHLSSDESNAIPEAARTRSRTTISFEDLKGKHISDINRIRMLDSWRDLQEKRARTTRGHAKRQPRMLLSPKAGVLLDLFEADTWIAQHQAR